MAMKTGYFPTMGARIMATELDRFVEEADIMSTAERAFALIRVLGEYMEKAKMNEEAFGELQRYLDIWSRSEMNSDAMVATCLRQSASLKN